MGCKSWLRFASDLLGIKAMKVALRTLLLSFCLNENLEVTLASCPSTSPNILERKPLWTHVVHELYQLQVKNGFSDFVQENVVSSREAFLRERDLPTQSVNQAPLYRFFKYDSLKKWIISASVLSKSLFHWWLDMKSDCLALLLLAKLWKSLVLSPFRSQLTLVFIAN